MIVRSILPVEGHLTAQEKTAIKKMFAAGWETARTARKQYQIISGTPADKKYTVEIKSYYTGTIGDNPKWHTARHTFLAME